MRANAARVLGAAEDKEAFDVLVKAAVEDRDSRVRVSAIRSLAALKDAKAADKLLDRGEALLADLRNPSSPTRPSRTSCSRSRRRSGDFCRTHRTRGRRDSSTDTSRRTMDGRRRSRSRVCAFRPANSAAGTKRNRFRVGGSTALWLRSRANSRRSSRRPTRRKK